MHCVIYLSSTNEHVQLKGGGGGAASPQRFSPTGAHAGIRLHLVLVWLWLANRTVGINTLRVSPVSVLIAAVKNEIKLSSVFRQID